MKTAKMARPGFKPFDMELEETIALSVAVATHTGRHWGSHTLVHRNAERLSYPESQQRRPCPRTFRTTRWYWLQFVVRSYTTALSFDSRLQHEALPETHGC